MLKVGDTVWWRGDYGTSQEEKAVVVNIELTDGDKYGRPVQEVAWAVVHDRSIVVDLDNGHFAYGYQIKPFGEKT